MSAGKPTWQLSAEEQSNRSGLKLRAIRKLCQGVLETGSATGSATTLAQRVLSILEGT